MILTPAVMGAMHPTEMVQRKTAPFEVPRALGRPGDSAQSITPEVSKVGKVLPEVLLVVLEVVHGPGGPGAGGGHDSLQHPLLGFLWAPREGASSFWGTGMAVAGGHPAVELTLPSQAHIHAAMVKVNSAAGMGDSRAWAAQQP